MEEGVYGVQFHHHTSMVNFGDQQGYLGMPAPLQDDDLHALISRIHQQPPPPSSSSYGSTTSSLSGSTTTTAAASSAIKAKIAAHPRYPLLLDAYIDCQKVGAPPEVVSLLEEIRREHGASGRASGLLGVDPELDVFMETYCGVLEKYKSDLARPFDEAATFLNNMELQLSDLCKGTPFRPYSSATGADDDAGSSDEELSGGEMDLQEANARDEEKDLKEKLLRKYSGYLSSLKQEFSKKKKKGKLPKQARQTLLDWWSLHYKWPYPTEADKIALAESTGLDQKQINNWFINQRKRHWKPSESMQFAVMDSLSTPFYG